MVKKRIVAFLLSLAMLVSVVCTPAFALESGTAQSSTIHWFYSQLSEQGKKIYDAIEKWYAAGGMKDGKASYDLVKERVVDESVVKNYLEGNRTLFNDFAAAKDAFDLEHPEAWYVDSSELSFRVTSGEGGALHAYMGPGRTEDYYVQGVAGASDVAAKSAELERVIDAIVEGAGKESGDYEKIRYAHREITRGISYRFENECKSGNAGYIRTAYALVTHEGVCEGYARSFQYVLNKLNIPCVLIHGVQTSGEPEAHMWCAVELEGEWYVVDPTWDDPIVLDASGNVKPGVNGVDGGETEAYLLVGQNIVGANWQPSGYVSTSVTAFNYPDIALMSYGSGVLEYNGLKVEYAAGAMEGLKSTVYHVSFNGDGLVKAAEKGYYLLVKMYDVNADGSTNKFDEWYYSVHGLHAVQSEFNPNNKFQDSENKYLADTDEYLIYNVINCEYVEFAVTTKAPPRWETANDLATMGGFYSGDYSDIVAQSDLIYNENGGYEQPPYIKNASPGFNTSVSAGTNYTIHIEFSDPLYRPSSENHGMAGKENDAPAAMGQAVGMDYRGKTYSWGVNGRQPHEFASKPSPENIRWVCETHTTHEGFNGINADCALTTLEYEFTSSTQWYDDSCQYEFYLTGLVGKKSNKFPNNWSYVFENKYPFWTCPLYSGYTWNLWAQPQLLDNPENLDFEQIKVKGVDGVEKSLAALREQMHLDDKDMNGRIVLSVQNIGESRSKTEELAAAINSDKVVKDGDVNVPADAVLGSSLYEIDFARICRCTVVQTGQSLRLCVGFPPGIDASMAGVVFKAYHFTRDIEGSCDKKHVHTGEIVSVEEIPITVTEYGLVITCKSFSPFEIVALDADKAGVKAEEQHAVVLVTDGFGKVLVDGKADKSGIIEFKAKGETHTFTIQPKENYAFDTVSFSGSRDIEVKNNTFTLSYDDVKDGSAILSVTFVPSSIKAADASNGEIVATPAVCNHTKTTVIRSVSATCTEAGLAEVKCVACGMVLTKAIMATGHDYVDGVCSVCGAVDPDYNAGQDKDPDEDPGKDPGEDPGKDPGKDPEEDPGKDPGEDPGKDPGEDPGEDPGGNPNGPGITIGPSTPARPTPSTPSTPSTPGQTVSGASGTSAGGSWTANMSTAKEGDTVTVTSKASKGYISAAPIVKDKYGNTVTVTKNENGTYSFIMPEGGVTVTGSYMTPAQMFSDVVDKADGGWYQDDLAFAIEHGLIDGDGAGHFLPDLALTRGMMVTLLYNLEVSLNGKPAAPSADFDDVPAGQYYTDAVAWASYHGIVKGSGNNTYNPNGVLDRQQMAAMLYQYVAYKGYDVSGTSDLSGYTDAGSIADWALAGVRWANSAGIVTGSNSALNPTGTSNRTMGAVLLAKFCRQIVGME